MATAKRKMTKVEREAKQNELLGHLNDLVSAEDEKADANSDFNERIKDCRNRIEQLRLEINSGMIEFDPQTDLPLAEG